MNNHKFAVSLTSNIGIATIRLLGHTPATADGFAVAVAAMTSAVAMRAFHVAGRSVAFRGSRRGWQPNALIVGRKR